MRVTRILVSCLLLGLVVYACASSGGTSNVSRSDYDVLTKAQLATVGEVSMMLAIQKLRPNWLSKRGLTTTEVTDQPLPESEAGREVMIMLNGSKLGGPNNLLSLTASSIVSARHFDGLAATARWGICCGAGVVYLETTPGKGTP
jgi:hypothetical protein